MFSKLATNMKTNKLRYVIMVFLFCVLILFSLGVPDDHAMGCGNEDNELIMDNEEIDNETINSQKAYSNSLPCGKDKKNCNKIEVKVTVKEPLKGVLNQKIIAKAKDESKKDTNILETAGTVVTYGNLKMPGLVLAFVQKKDSGEEEVYLRLYAVFPDKETYINSNKKNDSKSKNQQNNLPFNQLQLKKDNQINKLKNDNKNTGWNDQKYFGFAKNPTLFQITPILNKPILSGSKGYHSLDLTRIDPDGDGAFDAIVLSLLIQDGSQHLYTFKVENSGIFTELDHYYNNECVSEFSNCKTTSMKITALNESAVAVITLRSSQDRSKVKYSHFTISLSGVIKLASNNYDKDYPNLIDLFDNNGTKENDVATIDILSFFESRVHDTYSSELFKYNVGTFVIVGVYKSGKYQTFVSTPIENQPPTPFFDGPGYDIIGLQSNSEKFNDMPKLSPQGVRLEFLQWSHGPSSNPPYVRGMVPAFIISARRDDGAPVLLLHDIQSYIDDQCNGLWPAFSHSYAPLKASGYAGIASVMDNKEFPSKWVSLYGYNGKIGVESGTMSKNYGCIATFGHDDSKCVEYGGTAQYLIPGKSYTIEDTLNPQIPPLLFADRFLSKWGYAGEIKRDHLIRVIVNLNNELIVKLLPGGVN